MRLVARAPITVDGRDYRPGDVFELEGGQARSLLDGGVVELVRAEEPPKRKRSE